jgi:hypothetical protein
MSRRRRNQALNGSAKTSFFASWVSFEGAFPTVEDCRIEVSYEDLGRPKPPGRVYTKPTLLGRIECADPHCVGGGLDISMMLGLAVAERRADFEGGQSRCQGHAYSSTGQSCLVHFTVKGTITYRPTTDN